jgi:UDP-N-acetylmuramoyl-L-alanyl-D-glutamate--2,6-diaminopimelate ligase
VKPDGGVYGSLTTPDPVTLHRLLAGLAGEGVTHLAFEASSHGLDQRRLDGVRLRAGGFTNLGRDHLDYHATAEDYLDAKLRLFDTLLPADGVAVINMDDSHAGRVVERASSRGLRVLGISQLKNAEADAGARPDVRGGLVFSIRGGDGFTQEATFVFDGQDYSARLDLIGAYQVSNVSVAAGLAIAAGEDPGAVFKTLGSMRGVKGRLEVVGRASGAPVVIDYAHKPDALDAALRALRPFVSGRLICVFGCGGDRDRGKRPLMGGIASALADVVIVTDDNPRTEDAVSIRREILAGANGAREIGDRQDAIAEAVGMARAGDVVLVAGKGHETGQIIGDKVMPFSDHEAVANALKARP